MPYNIRLIHARDFLMTDVKGEVDLQTSKRILHGIASLSLPDQCDIVVDVRGAVSKASLGDVYEFVGEMVSLSHVFKGRKVAILDDDDEFFHGNAKFAESSAQNRGINLRSFTTFEEMTQWFISEPPVTPPDLHLTSDATRLPSHP